MLNDEVVVNAADLPFAEKDQKNSNLDFRKNLNNVYEIKFDNSRHSEIFNMIGLLIENLSFMNEGEFAEYYSMIDVDFFLRLIEKHTSLLLTKKILSLLYIILNKDIKNIFNDCVLNGITRIIENILCNYYKDNAIIILKIIGILKCFNMPFLRSRLFFDFVQKISTQKSAVLLTELFKILTKYINMFGAYNNDYVNLGVRLYINVSTKKKNVQLRIRILKFLILSSVSTRNKNLLKNINSIINSTSYIEENIYKLKLISLLISETPNNCDYVNIDINFILKNFKTNDDKLLQVAFETLLVYLEYNNSSIFECLELKFDEFILENIENYSFNTKISSIKVLMYLVKFLPDIYMFKYISLDIVNILINFYLSVEMSTSDNKMVIEIINFFERLSNFENLDDINKEKIESFYLLAKYDV